MKRTEEEVVVSLLRKMKTNDIEFVEKLIRKMIKKPDV